MELEDSLPPSVIRIVEHLARMARGYDNHLKWNEGAQLKSDLMKVPERWRCVDPAAFRARCLAEGMRHEDVEEITGYVTRARAGRRLVPDRAYRGFMFARPSSDELALINAHAPSLRTSRAW